VQFACPLQNFSGLVSIFTQITHPNSKEIVYSVLGPRIVSSFSAYAFILVRRNLKTCLIGFVNTTKKPLYKFYVKSIHFVLNFSRSNNFIFWLCNYVL
jgi:hypothetical protein